MYKDKDRQRKANKEATQRYRAKQRGQEGQSISSKGYIYLIQCVGFPYYKIGMSETSPEGRIYALQTGVPFELKLIKAVYVSKALEAERYLQELHADRRVRGEWFNFTDLELNGVLDKYEHISLFYRIIA